MPGHLKVGFTDRDPELRAQELGSTGLPLPYVVAHAVTVEDGRFVEGAAHELLMQYHVGKEWFCCSVQVAREAIEQACGGVFLVPPTQGQTVIGGSPLVPGHALEQYFASQVTTSTFDTRQRQTLDDEDDQGPLPPGHPSRGLL